MKNKEQEEKSLLESCDKTLSLGRTLVFYWLLPIGTLQFVIVAIAAFIPFLEPSELNQRMWIGLALWWVWWILKEDKSYGT